MTAKTKSEENIHSSTAMMRCPQCDATITVERDRVDVWCARTVVALSIVIITGLVIFGLKPAYNPPTAMEHIEMSLVGFRN